MVTAFLLIALGALASAKTDYAGCTSSTTVVNGGASIVAWVPGTGEICSFLDCGGGRAPPKKSVPGCPQYTGTATYSPDFLPGFAVIPTPSLPISVLPLSDATSFFAQTTFPSSITIPSITPTATPSVVPVLTSSIMVATSALSSALSSLNLPSSTTTVVSTPSSVNMVTTTTPVVITTTNSLGSAVTTTSMATVVSSGTRSASTTAPTSNAGSSVSASIPSLLGLFAAIAGFL